jgi:hypothetical protein
MGLALNDPSVVRHIADVKPDADGLVDVPGARTRFRLTGYPTGLRVASDGSVRVMTPDELDALASSNGARGGSTFGADVVPASLRRPGPARTTALLVGAVIVLRLLGV